MRPSSRWLAATARFGLLAAALATLGFPGCPADVSGPGAADPTTLNLTNLWPNDDGRAWTYHATWEQADYSGTVYLPQGSTVPEVSLGEVRWMLSQPFDAVPGATQSYDYTLQFQGDITTQSGVTAQDLRESYAGPRAFADAGAAGRFESRLLARIAEARPDLRGRLAKPASADLTVLLSPYFIHGYAWIKGPLWIGTYGDVDTLLAWKFLGHDLHPGARFDHQLVPSLADDIWLRAMVEGQTIVNVPGYGRVRNALSVVYLIDYGVSAATDGNGGTLGVYRVFDYGRVVYAPGVGPVSDFERRYAYVGAERTLGLHELALDLSSTGVGVPGPRLAVVRTR